MSFTRANRDFADTKAEGVRAEWLLLDLLTAPGWAVQPNQANWDLAAEGSAAKAYEHDRDLRLPDLQVIAPFGLGVECKSKEPRWKNGSIGWDVDAFRHAEQWQERCKVPVIYAIRDRTVAPLPANRDHLDNPNAWRCASLHALREHEPDRGVLRVETPDGDQRDKHLLYWPADVFWPLADLLEGRAFVAPALLRPKPPWGVGRLL